MRSFCNVVTHDPLSSYAKLGRADATVDVLQLFVAATATPVAGPTTIRHMLARKPNRLHLDFMNFIALLSRYAFVARRSAYNDGTIYSI